MSHKPLVVMVIPDLKGNGAERVVLTLAAGFHQQGCDVHIVVFKKFVELESSQNYTLHHFKKHYRWLPRSIRGPVISPLLDRFIVKQCGAPDLVLSNLMPVDRILAHSRLKNTYLILHNTLSKELLQGISPEAARRCKQELASIYGRKPTVSVSAGVKHDFDALFDNPVGSHQIYNPVDLEFVRKSAQEYEPDTSGYLVHVGKFKHQKRHDILIRAYHQSGINKPLVLVGQGGLQEDCEKLVEELGLGDKVIFAGFKSNPYPFIKHADLMVFSSEYEGLGLVVLEALALDTPVISTDCESGPGEMLPPQNLVPVNDVEQLANKIADAAANPAKYVSKLDSAFELDQAVERYLALIE
ncbi:MAG: glycosyltransferase [bacterium]